MGSIIRPGEVTGPVPDLPFLHMPERRTVFAERAARLRRLAEGHALADYLRFVALVADAQQRVLDAFPEVPLPEARERAICREHGLPPISATGWERSQGWREGLAVLLADLATRPLPAAAESAVRRLRSALEAEIEGLADPILWASYERSDRALAPLVAAGLQVYWTHLATALGAEAFVRLEAPGLCPACGSPPVGGVVRIGGAEQGLRYLACSLCGTQWHVVRAKCVVCDSSRGLGYYAIDGGDGVVRAEACDECRSYVKIAYLEKDPSADPVADDLASVAVDLLLDERGYQRYGVNPMLVPAEAAPDIG
jgi:FdhE protein